MENEDGRRNRASTGVSDEIYEILRLIRFVSERKRKGFDYCSRRTEGGEKRREDERASDVSVVSFSFDAVQSP